MPDASTLTTVHAAPAPRCQAGTTRLDISFGRRFLLLFGRERRPLRRWPRCCCSPHAGDRPNVLEAANRTLGGRARSDPSRLQRRSFLRGAESLFGVRITSLRSGSWSRTRRGVYGRGGLRSAATCPSGRPARRTCIGTIEHDCLTGSQESRYEPERVYSSGGSGGGSGR